ncbi:hypothetical protein CEUSTIGMA_g12141.t1 [Chlamydomonas eustigma]|uniref:Uncharacterized protein n=1 Tax=Chlamydomonas eustigma TaxID=1157962 RepID=A0A250XP50_9CHLO|nr:hypothetical protein CEUSTIGMA_g12141.t1 [Chlamydomonas eustigma]|eukprot:GAX84719.1 hypothetical protein CEUSTIGMA_g12141.t1 [Chlamydomonas eustigma]
MKFKMGSALMITRITLSITIVACGVGTWILMRKKTKGRSLWFKDVKPSVEKDEQNTDNTLLFKDSAQNCSACKELKVVYERMDSEFRGKGLNLDAIKAIQPWFHGLDGSNTPWPKMYKDFPEPLPENAVRILVIPLDGSLSLAAAAAAVTREVMQVLPSRAKV